MERPFGVLDEHFHGNHHAHHQNVEGRAVVFLPLLVGMVGESEDEEQEQGNESNEAGGLDRVEENRR